MFWIFIFVILFLVATFVLSILSYRMDAKERLRNLRRYESEKKSDEQIKSQVSDAMHKLKLIVYGSLTGIVLVITLFNSFFITNEQQTAFTMTFGKPTVVEGAGAHFKLPYITKSYKYDATTKGMAIGYDPENNESISEESLMITSDFNFVNTDFYLEYRISDPIEYKLGSDDPEGILRNIAQASIRNTVGLYGVDAVITTGKAEIQAIVKEEIIKKLQTHSTGLTIVNVTIQDAEPPTEAVSYAFKAVETAKQDAETAVNNAQKSEKEKIPNAEAEADQILKDAKASKTERINQATQESVEFEALFNEYMKNPDIVKRQLYYNVMKAILPDMEIIIGSDSKVIYVKNGQVTTDGN